MKKRKKKKKRNSKKRKRKRQMKRGQKGVWRYQGQQHTGPQLSPAPDLSKPTWSESDWGSVCLARLQGIN